MRLPEWIRAKHFNDIHNTKRILRSHKITTVCEEARCPNIGKCYSKPTVTFMILGSKCKGTAVSAQLSLQNLPLLILKNLKGLRGLQRKWD